MKPRQTVFCRGRTKYALYPLHELLAWQVALHRPYSPRAESNGHDNMRHVGVGEWDIGRLKSFPVKRSLAHFRLGTVNQPPVGVRNTLPLAALCHPNSNNTDDVCRFKLFRKHSVSCSPPSGAITRRQGKNGRPLLFGHLASPESQHAHCSTVTSIVLLSPLATPCSDVPSHPLAPAIDLPLEDEIHRSRQDRMAFSVLPYGGGLRWFLGHWVYWNMTVELPPRSGPLGRHAGGLRGGVNRMILLRNE